MAAKRTGRWLGDLLEGKIRSAYVMTEPGIASSDGTIVFDAKRDGMNLSSTEKSGGFPGQGIRAARYIF